MNPAIVLVAPEHADFLTDEFGRYARDYDVLTTTSVEEAEEVARRVVADGGQVAMFVSESQLPGYHVLEAFALWRTVVPTSRRLVAAHWSHFLADAPALRGGLAKGKYDAFLLMPRGVRDEEFHTAVCELLSDWGSTVAAPEVDTVRIVTPTADALTQGIRDFLDRMGMPNRTYPPDSEQGRDVIERAGGTPVFPLVEAVDREIFSPTSVRDVALRAFGTPTDIELDAVVDVAVVGAGPAGLAAAVYASSEGLTHGGAGVGGGGRPGRHVVDDPQLPRLPARHLRDAAGAAGAQPGDPVRHPVLHRVVGHRARGRHRRRAVRAAHRRRRRAGARRRGLGRRDLPQARGAVGRGARRPGRLLRQRDDAPPARWRATTWSSWAAATPPARPPSTWRSSRSR